MAELHHRYAVICKTFPTDEKNHESVGQVFKKWNTSDLRKFCQYLDRNFPRWTFFTVYNKVSRDKLATYTQTNRPGAANPFHLQRQPREQRKSRRRNSKNIHSFVKGTKGK